MLFDSNLTQKQVQGVYLEPVYILLLTETNFWVEIVGSDFI